MSETPSYSRRTRRGTAPATRGNGEDPAPPLDYSSYPEAQGQTLRKSKDRPLPKVEIYTATDLAAMEFPPIRWAVEGVLPAGTTLFAGPPKKGKTRLAFNIAFGIAIGGVVLGGIPVDPGEVLYIALDDPKRRLKDMLIATAEQNQIAVPDTLHFAFQWPCFGAGGEDLINDFLVKHPYCRFVCLDVLKFFRPIQPGKNFYAEDYAVGDALRPLAEAHNVAIMGNHHTNKLAYRIEEGTDPMQAISGTSGLPGGFDNTMVLYQRVGQADAFLYITGNDTETTDKALTWDNELLTWRIAGNAEDFAGGTEWLKLRALLQQHGPLKPLEAASLLYPNDVITEKSRPYNRVKQVLKNAKYGGRVILRQGDKRYYLP